MTYRESMDLWAMALACTAVIVVFKIVIKWAKTSKGVA